MKPATPAVHQQSGLRLRSSVNLWLVALRLACLAGLLATSVCLNWWTPVLAGALALSYRWSATRLTAVDPEDEPANLQKKRRWKNPLRGKPTSGSLTDLPEPRLLELQTAALSDALADGADDTDTVDDCQALRAFEPVRRGTACAFARRARLWGGPAWRPRLPLAANAAACAPRLRLFCRVCAELGLDGFVIRLVGEHLCGDFRRFSAAVYGTLSTLAACNTGGGGDCMAEPHRLHQTGWVFRFHGQTFFVTTFAPFYGPEDSRFAFGASDGFLLLQPELSFAQHDLPPDTPHTNWGGAEEGDGHQTVRDRIRCAFRDAGQAYRIRDTTVYPMIEDIVMPPKSMGSADLPEGSRWWEVGLAAENEGEKSTDDLQ
ncbi:hypothetical protein BOX15_Mlig006710g2 [Macrostomum lignano]|uniref:Uncharacterized protein n=1 Tax=Macrostomum lignano TaxID=282301 RepID=A0A267E6H7_9PLAT|nr:hypothetical protein BOX15_Mlig006710g2 [Macrostomum lignano]